MAQLSDDCFAFGGELMRTVDALALLTDRLAIVVDREACALRDAGGRNAYDMIFLDANSSNYPGYLELAA